MDDHSDCPFIFVILYIKHSAKSSDNYVSVLFCGIGFSILEPTSSDTTL